MKTDNIERYLNSFANQVVSDSKTILKNKKTLIKKKQTPLLKIN